MQYSRNRIRRGSGGDPDGIRQQTGSVHSDDRDNCAYLKRWTDDDVKLNWNWNDDPNPSYGSVSRGSSSCTQILRQLSEYLFICFAWIVSPENFFTAWREFRRGKRRKPDVQAFERHLEDEVFRLHGELVEGRYRHGPYQRFHVFDPKHRVIHKATVRDRLVHHAVHRVLTPIFDRSFIPNSYSCRIGKGTHAAVRRLETFVRRVGRNFRSPCWALQFDVKKFFDSVDHDILHRLLARKVHDVRTRGLLEEIVRRYRPSDCVGGGALVDRSGSYAGRGIPIGNLTSQLFANVYLDGLDHFVKEGLRLPYYIRYADDVVILHNDPDALAALLVPIRAWLWDERRLELHPHKITIRKLSWGIDFLGYVTLPHYRALRTKTKRRMLTRVDPVSISSYMGLLRHCAGRLLRRRIVSIAAARAADVHGTLFTYGYDDR